MRIMKAGATSQSIYIDVLDSSSTTGGRLTGLAYNTSSLTAYYAKNGAASVSITLATQTASGAYSSGGFVEVDATNMPGIYRLDIPDAAISSGASVVVTLTGATNMVPCSVEIQLTALDLQTASTAQTGDSYARLGAPAGASVSADIAAVKTDTAAVKTTTDKFAFTVANQVDANVLDWKSSAAPAMTGDAYARLGAPAGASVSADIAAMKTDTAAILDDTGTSGVIVVTNNDKTGYALSSSAISDLFTHALTESYAAAGVAPTVAQALFAILQFLMERSTSGTTVTIKKLDGSATAMTQTLDSASAPTSVTRAT